MKVNIHEIACLFGSLSVVVGALIYTFIPIIVHNKVLEAMRLVNGSYFYSLWAEYPFPIFMKIYLFNVINAGKILSGADKPILQELGPFVFREQRKKIGVKFNDNEGTVSYKEHTSYEFVPELSNGSLMDNLTMLNIPFTSLAMLKGPNLGIFEKMTLPQLIKIHNPTPFITKTVGEVLFDGYHDKFIHNLESLAGTNFFPNGMFGVLREKNNSYEDYTVFTGEKNPEKYLKIHKWQNSSSLSFWDSKYCNMINGSDGTVFGPFRTKSEKLNLFLFEFCRSVYLDYEDQYQIHGLNVYKYKLPNSILASPDIVPDNKCFCNKGKTCVKSGTFDISACQKDAPVVISLPHFYEGDDKYYKSIIGLNRSEDLHRIVLDIQPTVGVLMRINKRAQINLAVKSVPQVKGYENFTEMLFPILWMDENCEWTPEFASKFYDMMVKPQDIAYALSYLAFSFGTIVFLVSVLYMIFLKISNKKLQYTRTHGTDDIVRGSWLIKSDERPLRSKTDIN